MRTTTARNGRRKVLAILAGFLVFVGAIGLSLSSVEAASSVTPQSGPKGEIVNGTFKGKSQRVQTMLFRVDLNGTPSFVFCIDIGTAIEFGVPYTETDWTESAVPNLSKVARVLSQTNAIETQDPIEIAAAQAAIWHFSDGFELSTDASLNSPYVIARYQALVADANDNPVNTEPDATLEVTPKSATASYGQPIFFDVVSTSDGPIAIELSDSLVTAHPALGDVCDTASTVAATTAGSRICVTSASPRANVSVTLRSAAAPLSAGRVFVRPARQKLIIGKSGTAQSNATVTASWTENGRPNVSIECPPDGVRYGVPTTFSATASDPDGDALRYQWTVNGTPVDGATDATFTHSLALGEQISVTVTDTVGQSATADVTCATRSVPTVALICPSGIFLGEENTFTAVGEDVDGDTLRYEWTLNGNVVIGAEGPTFTTIINGGEDLRVRVIDPGGAASDYVVVSCIPTEVNEAPTVELSCPDSVTPGGGQVTYEASGSDRNGDELTYTWFVNGEPVDGVTGPSATLDVAPGDVVGVEVSDGALNSERVEIDCVPVGTNQPPTVALSCPSAVVYGEPTVFVANGVDPDGDPLTYRWSHNGEVAGEQTGPQATFVIAPGDTVSVQAIDSVSAAESETITIDCEGVTRPSVTITCPVPLVYGDPVTFIANGSDPGGEAALTYEWALNGNPIAGNSSARMVIALEAGDRLTVTAMSAGGVMSATASGDCVGNSRPSVALECPENLVFDRPTEFTAVGLDADGDELTYEWSIDDEVVAGESGPNATLSVPRGSWVSVTVTDSGGLTSEVATSTCAGSSTPTVSLDCPPAFFYGEPVTIRAVGEDADGDSLTYRWSLNDEVIDGATTSSITISLQRDDTLSVAVIDPSGNVSDAAVFDCTNGTSRPVVTLECSSIGVFGQPVTVKASISEVEDGTAAVYTWAVNGAILPGEYASTVSVILKPDDVVSVTATVGPDVVSRSVGTLCSTQAPPEVPQVPSTPQVLSTKVTSAARQATTSALAWTGSTPMRVVAIAALAIGAGGLAFLARRRLNTSS